MNHPLPLRLPPVRVAVLMVCLGLTCLGAPSQAVAASGAKPLVFSASDGALHCVSALGQVRCLGVSYAAVPVGDLRLRAPAPHASWRGVRNATRFGAACLQSKTDYSKVEEGAENCLYLNL